MGSGAQPQLPWFLIFSFFWLLNFYFYYDLVGKVLMSRTDGSENEGLSHFLRQEMHAVCQIGEPHGSQLLALLPVSMWSPAYMTGKGKKKLECLVSLPAAVCERSPPWELQVILKDLVQSFPLFRQCLVDMSGASFRRQSTHQPAKQQPQEMTHILQNKNPLGKKITDLLRTCQKVQPIRVMVNTSKVELPVQPIYWTSGCQAEMIHTNLH